MDKRENAQLTRSVIPGFGMCSQRAGAEIGASPDLYTACKVVNSHPDPAFQFTKPVCAGPACQVPNHTGIQVRFQMFLFYSLTHVQSGGFMMF